MHSRRLLIFQIIIFLHLLTASQGICKEDYRLPNEGSIKKNEKRSLLNVNRISYWVFNNGISGLNPFQGPFGLIYPESEYEAGLIYDDGFLWGGFVRDGRLPELRVGGSIYETSLKPGAIVGKGLPEEENAPAVRVWRIRENDDVSYLDKREAAEIKNIPESEVKESDMYEIFVQYRKDREEWPWQKGAPFYDKNDNGIMEEGEKPGIADADQVIWFVANDLDSIQCSTLAGSPPVGLEVQVTLWGYEKYYNLRDVIFKRYRIIYKGTKSTPNDAVIDSMFFTIWADADIGNYNDDLVGCDTIFNMGFSYNSVTIDKIYWKYKMAPPAIGYDLLQGPIVKGRNDDTAIFNLKKRKGSKNLKMSSFNYLPLDGIYMFPDLKIYDGTLQWYNIMQGLFPRAGTPYIGNNGKPVKYTFYGDPVRGDFEVDGTYSPPGNKCFEINTGPFKMALGDTQEVVIAIVAGIGADRLSSISAMKFNDLYAKYYFKNNFNMPKKPDIPDIKCTALDKKIVLNWGWNPESVKKMEEAYNQGYEFEGYNVYQIRYKDYEVVEKKLLHTYDLIDEITTITDKKFDYKSGTVVDYPVQIGKNSGIKRVCIITKDAFSGDQLVNGRAYYFAVTAYNYNGERNIPIHFLESRLDVKKIIPRPEEPGYRYPYQSGDTICVKHTGPGDGSVKVMVVDPASVTGHVYHVTFEEDAATGAVYWNLIDSTLNEVKLERQEIKSDDNAGFVIDGLNVDVLNPRAGIKTIYETDEDNHILASSISEFTEYGGPGTGTTGYMISNLSGEAGDIYDSEYKNDKFNLWKMDDIEYNFAEMSLTWERFSEKVNFDISTGKPFKAPFGVYRHIFLSGEDQRLFVGFWDWDNSGSWNVYDHWKSPILGITSYEPVYCWAGYGEGGKIISYNPEDNDKYIKEEYIWESINTGIPFNHFPYTRGILFCMYKDDAVLPKGHKIWFITNKMNSSKDTFSFYVKGINYSKDRAVKDIEKIRAYPNPFYGTFSENILNSDKYVMFNHLPEKADIYIFDLAGKMIQKLRKNDPSQFFRWDLKTDSGLFVASGIYIIKIYIPEINAVKIIKLAVAISLK